MNKGAVFAVLAAIISGISVFINGIAVKLSDPIIYTLMKNSGALVFLVAIVLLFNEWNKFRGLSWKQWSYLVLIGIIGGSIPFAMFFTGLSMSGAAASSFIFRSLFIFAGVFGYLILKENIRKEYLFAGLLILLGNLLLIPGELAFETGHLLVFGATVLWALEYTVSRKVMKGLHPRTVMVSRMLFGSLVLLGYLGATGALTEVAIDTSILLWLALTSLILTGFVVCWYMALKRLPVLQATTILATGGIVTALLNLVFLGKAVTLAEASGLVFILLGAVLMVAFTNIMKLFSVKMVKWTE
ncbi:DMT family transporter [Candidatus Micrarchaeota archaeon]|nr:DMT family transporter [Candidatus Micrarchaeota archaeon]